MYRNECFEMGHVHGKDCSIQLKVYADGNITKEMELRSKEFLRRFEHNSLPKRFVKIRYYGYLQNHLLGKVVSQHQVTKSPILVLMILDFSIKAFRYSAKCYRVFFFRPSL